MLLILGGLIVAVVGVVVFWRLTIETDSPFMAVSAICFTATIIVMSIAYVFAGWEWLAAEQKMKIINREYHTDYTQEEVFWASDVIDTIREIDRNRYEVNGNILSGKQK